MTNWRSETNQATAAYIATKDNKVRKDFEMSNKTIVKNDQTMINFKVDSVVKDSAEAVLAGMGLNTSAYLGMCLRKLAQDRTIPFDLKIDPQFWAAEVQVSIAASCVKSGLFEAAVDAKAAMIDTATKYFLEAIENVSNACADETRSGDKQQLEAVSTALQMGMAEFSTYSAVSMIEFAKSCADAYGALLPKEEKHLINPLTNIEEALYDVVDGFFGMPETLGVMARFNIDVPSLPTEKEQAMALDSCLDMVLSIAEKYEGQLTMRFVGSECNAAFVENEMGKAQLNKKLAEEAKKTPCVIHAD